MTSEETRSVEQIEAHMKIRSSAAFVEVRVNRGKMTIFGTYFMEDNPEDILALIRRGAVAKTYTVNAYTWDGNCAGGEPVAVGVHVGDVTMLGDAGVPVLPAHRQHGYSTDRIGRSALERLQSASRYQRATCYMIQLYNVHSQCTDSSH